MAWIWLMCAAALEVAWSAGMKFSDGLTRPGWTAFTVVTMVASFVALSLATRDLPLSVAYPAWVGAGVVGAALAGWAWFGEPLTPTRVAWLVVLVVAVAGVASGAAPAEPDLSP